jgi:hypothetical protein
MIKIPDKGAISGLIVSLAGKKAAKTRQKAVISKYLE